MNNKQMETMKCNAKHGSHCSVFARPKAKQKVGEAATDVTGADGYS